MPTALTPDEHRALELIAAESTGCLEHLLVSHGYSVDFLSGLIRSGLAAVTAEHIGSGPTARTMFSPMDHEVFAYGSRSAEHRRCGPKIGHNRADPARPDWLALQPQRHREFTHRRWPV
jgi:hypothetical protein